MSVTPEYFRAAESGAKLWFDDVTEGDSLPDLVVEPDTRQLVMYAGAAGDFVPIHYDKDVAKRAGHDRVIIHGALKSAWLAQLVTAWIGPTGWMREFSVQYRGVDYPGEKKICRGQVTGKRIESGAGLIDLELSLEDASGSVTTTGAAVVELPLRSNN